VELSTVEKCKDAWYRLVGVASDDPGLTEQGDLTDDVAYQYLTLGCRNAQRWMLKMGYGGWRKRSSALVFTGSDATDGGRKITLPSDFLRAYGNRRESALRKADGTRWASEVSPEDDHIRGDYYYVRGTELWITREAQPPSPLYLDYHYTHPLWSASLSPIDFPIDARWLIVAEGADAAKDESWLPGGVEWEQKIARRLARAREEARDIARATKSPRKARAPQRFGNRW